MVGEGYPKPMRADIPGHGCGSWLEIGEEGHSGGKKKKKKDCKRAA